MKMLYSILLSYFSICPCLCFNDVRNEIDLLWHLTRTAFGHYAFCPSFQPGEHNDILTTLISYIPEGILFLFYLHKRVPRFDNGWRSARVLKRETPSGGCGRTYKSLSDSFLTCLLWVAIQKIERQVYIGTIRACFCISSSARAPTCHGGCTDPRIPCCDIIIYR